MKKLNILKYDFLYIMSLGHIFILFLILMVICIIMAKMRIVQRCWFYWGIESGYDKRCAFG